MHWEVPLAFIKKLLPKNLEPDLYEGKAYIGVVPFYMSGVRFRFFPPIPTTSCFLELNVRTYVKQNGKAGVFFISLDAESSLAVIGGRRVFFLPYHHARMEMKKHDDVISYKSSRLKNTDFSAALDVNYEPTSEVYYSKPGSLENWMTERYCLYTTSKKGDIYWSEIHHKPWPLQKAKARIESNTMIQGLGDVFNKCEPLLHFSKKLDVAIYKLKKL